MAGPHVIVVGGGTMGLASAWALARRGAKVTVLERFEHVHARGSHGGHTRIIRESYHEGAGYVPLVREAARLWDELSERTGDPLLVRTGMVEVGPPDDAGLSGDDRGVWPAGRRTRSSRPRGRAAALALRDRRTGGAPAFTPAAGYLRVAAVPDALRREAERAGAVVRHHARVVRELVRDGDGVQVRSSRASVVAGIWRWWRRGRTCRRCCRSSCRSG
jgi:glycine/D-amino acid oxidase-like deaminating enzyme